MLTDKPIDLDVHLPQTKNINMIKESMYLDLSSLSIPLSRYRKFEKSDLNKINNNVEKTDKNIEMFNNNSRINSQSHTKVPINMMPPPPHKISHFNNGSTFKNEKKDYKVRESCRSGSPRGYDSDESCTSCSSSADSRVENEGMSIFFYAHCCRCRL